DAFRIHERHEQPLLCYEWPQPTEGSHRDGLALQSARKEKLLHEKAIPQRESVTVAGPQRRRLHGSTSRQIGHATAHQMWHRVGQYLGILAALLYALAEGRGCFLGRSHECFDGLGALRSGCFHERATDGCPLLGKTFDETVQRRRFYKDELAFDAFGPSHGQRIQ